jgi:shikimate kinase
MVSDRRGGAGQRCVALVGFMASGKSTIGRRLATRLRMGFLDTDDEIEKTFACSIGAFFALHGEAAFRTFERELILGLLDGQARILSVGGGAYVDSVTREALNQRATTVWLDPPFELILDRLRQSSERPLAAARSAAELRQLWVDRRESYATAHIHVATSDTDPDRVIERILNHLG